MLWFTVDCDLPDHPKMAALPNDTARYGWIVALARAKRQRQQGTFSSEVHFRTVMGKYGRYLADYLKAHLLDREQDGSLVVHDWSRHQWKVKKAGQRGENEGTNEGQEGDPHAGAGAVSLAVGISVSDSEELGTLRAQGAVSHLVALKEVTLLPVERVDARTRREFDRLADQRGSEAVGAAIREVAERIPTQPPSARQLMIEVLKELEPFAKGDAKKPNSDHLSDLQRAVETV